MGYAVETLASGLTLARLLRRRVESVSGVVSTRMPGISRGSLEECRSGGKLPVQHARAFRGPGYVAVPIPDTSHDLAAQVGFYLEGGDGRDDLEWIARSAETVVIGAYDGEGYLFWRPVSGHDLSGSHHAG